MPSAPAHSQWQSYGYKSNIALAENVIMYNDLMLVNYYD